MRVKIGTRIYDTAKAVEVGRQTVSFFGDPYGFEEIMFQKDGKEYFLLANGGELSQYQTEQIIPLNLVDARAWLMRITGEEHANYLIKEEDVQASLTKKPRKVSAKKEGTKAKAKAKKTATKVKPAAKKSATKEAQKEE